MKDEGLPCAPPDRLIGESHQFRKLLARIERAASSHAPILIQGETGTGKGLCARAIHDRSDRASSPFIRVNCAMSPDLIENEMFGHERGAFTSAGETRRGLVHQAENGTLFLDDLDLLAPAAQAKLLGFLDAGEFRPLGSLESREADVRITAATNIDLLEAVRAGRFRQDLYFRLNVLRLTIAPLRERREDILPLARHFLGQLAGELRLSPGAEAALIIYDWPGNARELRHVVERARINADGRPLITEGELELPHTGPRVEESFTRAKARLIGEFERTFLSEILTRHRGNVTKAARSVRMDRRTLQRLIRKYEMNLDRFRDGSS